MKLFSKDLFIHILKLAHRSLESKDMEEINKREMLKYKETSIYKD